jgi:hypothetical protein
MCGRSPDCHVDAQIIIRGVRRYLVAALMLGGMAQNRMQSPLRAALEASNHAGSASPMLADLTDRVVKTVVVPDGTPIRIDATMATLTVTGSNRSDVLIEVVRHAPSAAALARYPAVIEQRNDALHITVVQAADGHDADLKADITVRVPSGALVQAIRVFEGRVRVTNLKRACDVDLRRGAIEATGLAGRIRLESGIGSVDVRDSELTPGGMMRLRVFNGPLRVRFARRPASARILAVTFNGAIASDIPLTTKDQFGPRFGETTLGAGDPVMSLDVVKGDIAIRVGRQ